LAEAVGKHPTLSRVTLAAMKDGPLEKFLRGLAGLDTGGLEKLTLRDLGKGISGKCLDTLCSVVKRGRVKCLQVDTLLAPEQVDRLRDGLEQAAGSTSIEIGGQFVLTAAQTARLRPAQPAAVARSLDISLQPSVEIQCQVQQALQLFPIPVTPAVLPVTPMPVAPSSSNRGVIELKQWRAHAEQCLRRGDLNQFMQAMTKGQLAPLNYDLQELRFLTQALMHVPALTRVHLISVSVTAADASSFGQALLKHRTLKKLGLTHCRHQPGAFAAMADALTKYGGLEVLKIGVDPNDIDHKQDMQAAVHQLVERHPDLRKLTLAGEWIDSPQLLFRLLSAVRKLPQLKELELESCPADLFDSLMDGLRAQAPWRLPQLTLKRVSGDLNVWSFDNIVRKLALCPIDRLRIKAVTLSDKGMQGLVDTMVLQWTCQTQVEFDLVNQLTDLADMRQKLHTANGIVASRLQILRSTPPPLQF
jgi:hypothetical protein